MAAPSRGAPRARAVQRSGAARTSAAPRSRAGTRPRTRAAAAAGAGPLAALAPVVDVRGPHVRLGVLWALAAGALLIAGMVPTVVLFSALALVAAAQACTTWRTRPSRPVRPVAVAGAALLPAAAAGGPVALGIAAAVVGAAAAVAPMLPGVRAATAKGAPSFVLTGAIPLLVGAAAAAPVLARAELGLVPALVLLAVAAAYDAGAYVVGSGAANRWEGVLAGMVSIGSVSLAVAALLVPPFRGESPWILGGVAAATAPLGPYVASALLGRRRAKVPALRRLDSLVVLGPAWVVAATALIEVGGR